MNDLQKSELENRLRQALREHQHEGLNMIGNADHLLHRLIAAVEQWLDERPIARQKTA